MTKNQNKININFNDNDNDNDNEDQISQFLSEKQKKYDETFDELLQLNKELTEINNALNNTTLRIEKNHSNLQENHQEIASRKHQIQAIRGEIHNISYQLEEVSSYIKDHPEGSIKLHDEFKKLLNKFSELINQSNEIEIEINELSNSSDRFYSELSEYWAEIRSLQQHQIYLMSLSETLRKRQQTLSIELTNFTKNQNEDIKKKIEAIKNKRREDQTRLNEIYEKISIREKQLLERESKISQDSAERLKDLQERETRLSRQEKTALDHLAKQRKDFEILREKEITNLHTDQARVKEMEKELILAKERQTKEYQNQLEKSSAKYINETLKTLNNNHQKAKSSSSRWRAYGALSLIVSFSILFYLSYQINPLDSAIGWKNISYLVLRGSAIVALAGGFAAYAIQASNRQSLEAAAIASKIHGIEYGAFFINTYGANARWDDIDKAFRHWHKHEETQVEKKKNPHSEDKLQS